MGSSSAGLLLRSNLSSLEGTTSPRQTASLHQHPTIEQKVVVIKHASTKPFATSKQIDSTLIFMPPVIIHNRYAAYRVSGKFGHVSSVKINASRASLLALFCWTLMLSVDLEASESQVEVDVLNYVRAKTAAHFDSMIASSGGINQWTHTREPQPIDQQRVKRMNRDTLFSSAVVDISKGAVLTLPDAGSRYMSAVVVNEDHFINNINHGPGERQIELSELDTPFVLVTVRTLANASDARDIKKANALQDRLELKSQPATAYTHPPYDEASLAATAKPLLKLAAGLKDAKETFGKKMR